MSLADLQLDPAELTSRSFLLGNGHALSLCLPAATGDRPESPHCHKWYGAYLHGWKFIEGQLVRASVESDMPLDASTQTGFTMGVVTARRDYRANERPCSEEYFVARGIDGVACLLTGDVRFSVEPMVDLRLQRAPGGAIDGYVVEPIENGCLVTRSLPGGRYDDRTETFLPDGSTGHTLVVAIQVIGAGAKAEIRPRDSWERPVTFPQDAERAALVSRYATAPDSGDHAPLWRDSRSRLCAPVTLTVAGPGTVVYGFGETREEALANSRALRDGLPELRARDAAWMRETVTAPSFETGNAETDAAFAQVLARLMGALVVRERDTPGTAPTGTTAILAGNAYFHDAWKRDENIALSFLLALGRYDLAREVIESTWQLQDELTGRLPQRIRPGEDLPYTASDGTLWALLRLHQYWERSGDVATLESKLPMAACFFARSLERAWHGLLPSGRTIDPDYLWETWMDTPHTPRDGFPIEVQILWLTALRLFRPLVANGWPELAAAMRWAECQSKTAMQHYILDGLPADSLDPHGKPRQRLTPNPYFAFGVGFDFEPGVEAAMRCAGRRELAGMQGIATLAPNDWPSALRADLFVDGTVIHGRRMRSIGKETYHQGVEWNWLTQFFVAGELKAGNANDAWRHYLSPQVNAALKTAGIGGISELHHLDGPLGPDFQTWSMAALVQSLTSFAGIVVNVPEKLVSVRPQLPDAWPHLTLRGWYGECPFDLRVERHSVGTSVEILFPHAVPPAVTLEIGILLPAGAAPPTVGVDLDGVAESVSVRREVLPDECREWVIIAVPAHAHFRVSLQQDNQHCSILCTA
jgi:glycogen debranching enzyme